MYLEKNLLVTSKQKLYMWKKKTFLNWESVRWTIYGFQEQPNYRLKFKEYNVDIIRNDLYFSLRFFFSTLISKRSKNCANCQHIKLAICKFWFTTLLHHIYIGPLCTCYNLWTFQQNHELICKKYPFYTNVRLDSSCSKHNKHYGIININTMFLTHYCVRNNKHFVWILHVLSCSSWNF